jgi:DNA-binding transcriptional LysR family regulator
VTDSENPPIGSLDFTFSPFEYPNLTGNIFSRVIFTDAAFLAVPNGHRLMYEGQVELSELKDETLIVPFGDELLCSFAANRQLAERYAGNKLKTLKTANVETALLLVNMGKGVSIIPQYLAENAVMNPKIIGIATKGCKFEVLEYWNQTKENPAAKLFHEELESYLRK